MTPEIQREALSMMAEVWALVPDMRLGQLMAHLGFLGEAHLDRGLGDIEDDELMAILYRHRAERLARSLASTTSTTSTGGSLSVSGSPTLVEAADRR